VEANTPERFNAEQAMVLTTLAKDVISDPAGRRAFAEDAHRAAANADVDLSVLPESVVDTLKGMSERELQLLAELDERLTAEGIYVEFDGMKTCIFL
jgi:hypothetical protein